MKPVITIVIFITVFALLLLAQYFYSDPLYAKSISVIEDI